LRLRERLLLRCDLRVRRIGFLVLVFLRVAIVQYTHIKFFIHSVMTCYLAFPSLNNKYMHNVYARENIGQNA